MRELQGHGGVDDERRRGLQRVRSHDVRRQQRHQGAEALAAGVAQVARGLGDEGVVRADRALQPLLHGRQVRPQDRLEGGVADVQDHALHGGPCGVRGGHAGLSDGSDAGGAGRVGQRTKTPAALARSSSGPGKTPIATVTARPVARAAVVHTLGTATVGASAVGSVKNMRTTTRA